MIDLLFLLPPTNYKYRMKKNFLRLTAVVTMVWLMPTGLLAQFGNFTIIPCQDSAAVVALIDTVFLKGVNQSQYKNISFKGDPKAVGYFYDGFMFGGFETKKGIVMSTGLAENLAVSNNCTNNVISGNTSGGSDGDLGDLVNATINDACVIEFDFKPTNQMSSFRYVFGSEEYPEYVGSSFNDVFGFFLSGDGISGPYSNGSVNIALIPGTGLPVSINNVNCGNTSPNCQPGPGGTYCDMLIENIVSTSPAFKQMALNAYTISFTAENLTTPCSWYHIKLAIGDAGDSAWDSGVFLEMGSFDPGKVTETTNFSHPTVDSLLYESCKNHEAVLYFDIGTERLEDFYIPFRVEGTATRGYDYLLFSTKPDTIFIPAGATYDSIRIRPFLDAEEEGIETIEVKYIPVICGMGFEETTEILLSDVPEFNDMSMVVNSLCEDTVTLSFEHVLTGIPPYTYQWLPDNQNTAQLDYAITGVDSAAVPCVITDTCGFQVIDTAFVIVPNLQADAGPDKSLCNLPNVQLEGACVGAQHFTWTANPPDPSLTTPNIPDPIVSPTVNTAYTMTVSDNCTNSDTDEASVLLDVAVANAGVDQVMCINETVTLACNSGVGYSWTSVPVDPTLATQATNQTIQVSPATSTVYSVAVTNDCGFTASDEVEVVVNSLPTAFAGNDDEICFNESYTLQASGGVKYQWSAVPPDPSLSVGQQDTLANPTVQPDTQTNYIYSVVVTNENGCEAEAEMQLAVNPVPDVSMDVAQTTLCFGETTTLTAVGNADYTWTSDVFDPDLAAQMHNQSITVSPSQTTTYTLEGVVSGFNCPATLTQTITVVPLPTSPFSLADTVICQNQSLLITYAGNASPNADYQWTFDNAILTSGSGAGPYVAEWDQSGLKVLTLTVVDQGCAGTETTKTVEVLNRPQPDFSAQVLEGCAPLTVEFSDETQNTGLTSTSYLWDFSTGENNTESNPVVTFTDPGTYTVSLQVTNDGLCVSQKTENAYILVNALPVADFLPDPEETILEQGTISFNNNSTDDTPMTYSWNFGDGSPLSQETNPEHTYSQTGEYIIELEVVNNNGCEDTISKKVIIHPDFAVYAPTAFTPNGDGKNDSFEVKGIGIKTYQIQIYSRWGELIYESKNLSDQWDGTIKGTPAPAGSYVYKITYRSMIDLDYTTQGTVTLIR